MTPLSLKNYTAGVMHENESASQCETKRGSPLYSRLEAIYEIGSDSSPRDDVTDENSNSKRNTGDHKLWYSKKKKKHNLGERYDP